MKLEKYRVRLSKDDFEAFDWEIIQRFTNFKDGYLYGYVSSFWSNICHCWRSN